MVVSIGYLASAFLAVSLLMTNTLKFRWFNTLGNVAFITYGILINAFPIIVANSVLLCINFYQLIKLYRYKEQFQLVAINEMNNIVQQFLKFYKKDIESYFPQFVFLTSQNKICFVVLRDLSIANLFVAEISNNGEAIVEINYTVPNYRDFKIGKFIFDTEKDYLLQHNVKKILYKQVHNKNHIAFLIAMGFKEVVIENRKEYWKDL